MMFKRGIGMLALAAVVSSLAIPVVPRQNENFDIDAILDEMDEQYKDPEFAHEFASVALAYASAAITGGEKVPSEEEFLAELATMDTKMVPSFLSDAMATVNAVLEEMKLNPGMESQISEALSAFQNTSVMSRLTTMLSNIIQNLSEDQEEGNIGTPTSVSGDDSKETDSAAEENDSVDTENDESATESKGDSDNKDDKDDEDNKDDDNKDDDNKGDDTGIASSLSAGAYVISVAVSLGTIAALF